ncbi:hypothetical protein [uncultured Fibrella sp.]|uniref:hypothetical protein n=1 Tax=uncultured Fibrella sp. TaxID=1284596 RepID=UPI0035CC80C6
MTDEDEPSPEFSKGFNHGYQLSKHEPELLNKLLQVQAGNTPNDYTRAMQQGKEQHQRETLMAEMKAIRDKQKKSIKRKR